MRSTILVIAVGLMSCGGNVIADGPGGSTSATAPTAGTSACDDPPGATCVICSDNKWHCAIAGGPYEPCPTDYSTCTTGKSCITCNGDGTGLVCDGADPPSLLRVKCSQ